MASRRSTRPSRKWTGRHSRTPRWSSRQRHGIEQAVFFTTLIGSSKQSLTYLLKWESLAERERKWNAFASDPEWVAARAASEAEAIIVDRIENSFLSPTAYSSVR